MRWSSPSRTRQPYNSYFRILPSTFASYPGVSSFASSHLTTSLVCSSPSQRLACLSSTPCERRLPADQRLWQLALRFTWLGATSLTCNRAVYALDSVQASPRTPSTTARPHSTPSASLFLVHSARSLLSLYWRLRQAQHCSYDTVPATGDNRAEHEPAPPPLASPSSSRRHRLATSC